MITAGYLYVPVTPVSMFDPQMAAIAILAAKDQYDEARQDYKDFLNRYSDFNSSAPGANEAYDKLTSLYIQNGIDKIYERGEDPFRSDIGRQMLQHVIRNAKTNDIINVKTDAAVYEKYQEAKQKLQQQGLYSDEFEDEELKQAGLNNFIFGGEKRWNRYSPTPFLTRKQITEDYVKGLEDSDLGKFEYDENGNIKLDSNGNPITLNYWRAYGKSSQAISNALLSAMKDLMHTANGRFFIKLAYEEAKLNNPNATTEELNEEANKILLQQLRDAHRDKLKVRYEFDKEREHLDNYLQDAAKIQNELLRITGGGGSGNRRGKNNSGLWYSTYAGIHDYSQIRQLEILPDSVLINGSNYNKVSDGDGGEFFGKETTEEAAKKLGKGIKRTIDSSGKSKYYIVANEYELLQAIKDRHKDNKGNVDNEAFVNEIATSGYPGFLSHTFGLNVGEEIPISNAVLGNSKLITVDLAVAIADGTTPKTSVVVPEGMVGTFEDEEYGVIWNSDKPTTMYIKNNKNERIGACVDVDGDGLVKIKETGNKVVLTRNDGATKDVYVLVIPSNFRPVARSSSGKPKSGLGDQNSYPIMLYKIGEYRLNKYTGQWLPAAGLAQFMEIADTLNALNIDGDKHIANAEQP